MPFLVMSEELGRSRDTKLLRKTRPAFFIVALLAAAFVPAVVVIACDETGPSPVGEHPDDAEVDAAKPKEGGEGGEGGEAGKEAGKDAGAEGGDDASSDAGDAADEG